jgi:hypothetical protein
MLLTVSFVFLIFSVTLCVTMGSFRMVCHLSLAFLVWLGCIRSGRLCVDVCVPCVWIVIHFSRNPENGGYPPNDNSDVNIMNFIRAVSLFVISILLINEVFNNFKSDVTVISRIE